jgi:hypothetical protein
MVFPHEPCRWPEVNEKGSSVPADAARGDNVSRQPICMRRALLPDEGMVIKPTRRSPQDNAIFLALLSAKSVNLI